MKKYDYVQANRAAWNQAAPFHEHSKEFSELVEGISRPNYSCLDAIQTEWLTKIDVKGKDVVHLCCNNGREILSIENMGAKDCVGIDISGNFIKQARHLAKTGKYSCQFIESDVYDISNKLYEKFDLCVLTIGVFGWMPDINRFFAIINCLLKPGGKLFVHEEHPIVNMFDPHGDNPLQMVNSYFQDEPFVESEIIVYDGEDRGTGETHYWFVHPLSDIFTNCLSNGFRLETFQEYAENISSEEFDIYEDQRSQLPLSYVLVASKSAYSNTGQ